MIHSCSIIYIRIQNLKYIQLHYFLRAYEAYNPNSIFFLIPLHYRLPNQPQTTYNDFLFVFVECDKTTSSSSSSSSSIQYGWFAFFVFSSTDLTTISYATNSPCLVLHITLCNTIHKSTSYNYNLGIEYIYIITECVPCIPSLLYSIETCPIPTITDFPPHTANDIFFHPHTINQTANSCIKNLCPRCQ